MATVSSGPWIFRAVATADALSHGPPTVGERVDIRLAGDAGHLFGGTVLRVARAGSRKIDRPALTHLGGGSIAVAKETMEAEEPFFQITIGFDPTEADALWHEMTGIVRFARPYPSLATHLYRRTLHFLDRLQLAG